MMQGRNLRALVLDSGDRQSLAACRALGQAGHFVGSGWYRTPGIAVGSRYVRASHRLPHPSASAPEFRGALESAIIDGDYQVVIAVDDLTLARLDSIEFNSPTMPTLGPGFRALTDKLELAALAEKSGVDYPRTFTVSRDASTVRGLAFPVVVKARHSAVATPTRAVRASGARLAHTQKELVDRGSVLASRGLEPIFQERTWTPTKVNVVIIRRSGRSELRYAHRVLREIPRDGGMGITLVTVAPTDPLARPSIDALERVCDAAGYEGLVQAEFYVDATTGRAWLIDVNPRLWGSAWFAETLGLRVTERAVHAVLGEAPGASPSYPINRRFHHSTAELRWLKSGASSRAALLELLRSTSPRDVFEYHDPSDKRALARFAWAKTAARFRPGRDPQ